MAKPLLSEIFQQARARLGDDSVGGGEVFLDSVLFPHFKQALRELFRAMRSGQEPYVQREAFWVLPINTSVLDPATAGITDLAELEFVYWRPVSRSVNISNVVVSGGLATITSTAHGLLTGQVVMTSGIGGFDFFNSPNGSWTINVVDANTFQLLGCTATGTYTSGGTAVVGVGDWAELTQRDFFDVTDFPANSANNPNTLFVWEGGVFKFLASGQARQLRIIYRSSGQTVFSAGFDAVIPLDDSVDFLAVRTASLAAPAKGAAERGQELKVEALGRNEEADGSGGLLRSLIVNDVRSMQAKVYRRPPYRQRRNGPTPILY